MTCRLGEALRTGLGWDRQVCEPFAGKNSKERENPVTSGDNDIIPPGNELQKDAHVEGWKEISLCDILVACGFSE